MNALLLYNNIEQKDIKTYNNNITEKLNETIMCCMDFFCFLPLSTSNLC